ncbi:MAG: DMT family transporter, partial [Actinobacteria bacterium]|nr:DMT family transporter [Actinomycetota bacterium]
MDPLGRRPVLTALIGALVIAWSAPLVRLADVPPATAASLRCLLALPLLALLARREQRRHGRLPVRTRQVCALAGIFFAFDLVLWHHVIAAVGAGLATVLGNLQVLVVAAVAWWLLGERPPARLLAALPVLLLGVALVSGALGGQTYGRDPRLGVLLGLATSVAYALFLLVLRQGSTDLRLLAGPLLWATGSAAAFAALLGVALGELVVPGWQALFWLAVLALTAQVLGWLLISSSLPRLPAALTSVLLLAQPIGALAISAVVLSETPTAVQYAGAACILAGVVVATATRRTRLRGPVEQAGHRAVLEDLPDCPGDERGDRENRQPVEASAVVDGQGVGDDHLADAGVLQPVEGRPGQHTVRRRDDDVGGAVVEQQRGGLADRAAGVDHVVDQDAGLVLDLPDDLTHLHLVGHPGVAPLVDDRE